ncbi:MAG: hypothetical protein M4579_000853 [Chaenotheca gracillima]|nr:MAG: hypothetical protein M4579_000853 [Chaenotheca gracillima]
MSYMYYYPYKRYCFRRLQRWILGALIFALVIFFCFSLGPKTEYGGQDFAQPLKSFTFPPKVDNRPQWQKRAQRHPVTSFISLPSSTTAKSVPRIQHPFGSESFRASRVRLERRDAVKANFNQTWAAYKEYAWLWDELRPISAEHRDNFCGWAVSLIDALDTLWIMDMREEFAQAVKATAAIDFTAAKCRLVSVFETTIRVLGGLLGAYDISGEAYPALLAKAEEIGEFLFSAFDTPNRMPVLQWDWKAYIEDESQFAGSTVPLADLGSLTLEFTRLSQLTGNPKYFDAVQRITDLFEETQDKTKLPGLWPRSVDAYTPGCDFDNIFSVGSMADSMYEYLPKQHLILGGHSKQYRKMFERSMDMMKKHVFYRPMTKGNDDILFAGDVTVFDDGHTLLRPNGEHLKCYVGGMVGIGARAFKRPKDLAIARRLVDGCIWAYQNTATGLMPEKFTTVRCDSTDSCEWNEEQWQAQILVEGNHWDSDDPKESIQRRRLTPGYTGFTDKRYLLRPEAIESIFILYRLTGDTTLQDRAWDMWEAIQKVTRTDFANAPTVDVTMPTARLDDSMESFWMGETLKYFYLVFSEPDLVSLDDFVLNTEAHPLRRPPRR